ncbi:MAG: hypothetical protein NUW22_03375 [Acidobacteria bacterium]|nr:hypothetical protein [Acidobacteriota bacterium]
MMETLAVAASQIWPLALVMLVLGWLVRRGSARRRNAQVARNTANARLRDMDYTPPGGDDAGGPLRGVHRFDGTTRGIAWTLETLYLTDQDAGVYSQRRNTIQNYSRWTAAQASTGGGALLLMNLPEGERPPALPSDTGTGFLDAITNKAAEAALHLFARVNFGADRAASLPLAPEHRVPLASDAFGTAFVAFSDRPPLLDRLTPKAREWLLTGRDKRVAFLWDAQGLTLTWPTPHLAPDAVTACAAYGAELAGMLVDPVSSPV